MKQPETRLAYTIAETMIETRLGRDSIYGAIRSGKLVARKSGRRTIITSDDLRAFLNSLPKMHSQRSTAA